MNLIDDYFKPFLDSISEGSVFRKVIGHMLHVVAVLGAVSGFFTWLYSFGELSEATFIEGIGILVLQLFNLVIIPVFFLVIWLRGTKVLELEPSPFTIIPIFAIILRLIGELFFFSLILSSIPSMIAIWCGAGSFISMHIPPSGFLEGLSFGIGLGIGAFMSLVFFYFLAELMEVYYRMAVDIHKARATLEDRTLTMPSQPATASDSLSD